MKNKILHWLFQDQPKSQYLTYKIRKDEIVEQVFLTSGDSRIDISFRHAVLSQVPFIIGVLLPKPNQIAEKVAIEFYSNNIKLSCAHCKLNKKTEYQESSILLMEIVSNKHSRISWFRQKSLLLYFYRNRRNNVLFKELDGFFTTYSFPREIIITSFTTENHSNIFPMDLIGNWSEKGLFILGLRNTNVTLKEMLVYKKFVVSNIDASEKANIFYLGSHHSKTPPSLSELPFDLLKSEKHGYLIPDFTKEYRELSIIEFHKIGTHTIMVCKIDNHVILDQNYASLYHLHIGMNLRKKVMYTKCLK